MTIRSYQAGDEGAQAEIYNLVAGQLPGCKPSQAQDVRRRTLSRDFDPKLWHYALEGDQVVGYCMTQPNGRVSFPWCKPGNESSAEPLFQAAVDALRARGHRRVFAAYPASWTEQAAFFAGQSMPVAREMINFLQDMTQMPTRHSRGQSSIDTLKQSDIAPIMAMCPELWRGQSPEVLERAWLSNPYYPPTSMFVVRSRTDQQPLAVGLLIDDEGYSDPEQLDASQACFRLGAFGTEGLTYKKVNGLFSLVLPRARSAMAFAMELMDHAASLLDGSSATSMAAQVPSDAPHLVAFYQTHFRRQASFPMFERIFTD